MQKMEKTKTCNRREIEAHAFATKTRSREISANKNQIVLTEKWQESKVMNFHLKKRFSQISSVLNFAMFLAMIVCRFFGGDGSSLFFWLRLFFPIFFVDIFFIILQGNAA